jgi:hypothetical protein
MGNNFAKDTSSKMKALGIYQIAGGIIGLLLTFWIIAGLTAFPGLLLIILSVAIGLYSHSIYCGALLLKNKISGLGHSLINQFFQLMNFIVAGFAFQFISGVFLTIGLDLTDSFNFTFNIGISTWQININGDTEPLMVNFNLVALFLILFIEKLKKKINQENLEKQLASIGK